MGLKTLRYVCFSPSCRPVIGPIVGGFVSIGHVDGGWRFVFWVMFIFAMIMFVSGFFLLPEW